jgi:hypothetical protein
MNLAMLFFYAAPVTPTSGVWMTWSLVGVLALITLMLALLFEDKAARTKYDALATAAERGVGGLSAAERAVLQGLEAGGPAGSSSASLQ